MGERAKRASRKAIVCSTEPSWARLKTETDHTVRERESVCVREKKKERDSVFRRQVRDRPVFRVCPKDSYEEILK